MTSPLILVVDDSKTVRKVLERTLRRAGYRVTLAAGGPEALEACETERPDMVLVDLVMPQMSGSELCQELRANPRFADIPQVIMSARDNFKLDAVVSDSGANDAITKPFGPEALRAVTARVLSKGHESLRPVLTSQPPPSPSRSPVEASRVATATANRIADRLGETVRQFTGTASPTNDQFAASLMRGFSIAELEQFGDEIRHTAAGLDATVAFEGSCEKMPLVDVLQLLERQSQTGLLTVTHGDRRIIVCFRAGMIAIALGHGGEREFLLGRYLIDEGWITPEALDQAVNHKQGGSWLGERLVASGALKKELLRAALVRQTSELLYESMRWRGGRFYFEHGAARSEAEDARLGLPMASILLEGLRRIDEWRLIEEQIRDFGMLLERRQDAVSSMREDSFTSDERTVLALLGTKRTVREVVAQTSMSSFDTCKILFRLMTSGLVAEHRESAPTATDSVDNEPAETA